MALGWSTYSPVALVFRSNSSRRSLPPSLLQPGGESCLILSNRSVGFSAEQFRRMKFCLVDRIAELVPGELISTQKNVSLAEEYLQDHFPGFSVLPGVMMVETMVQSCAWLSRVTDDFRFSTLLLKQAKAVKFNSFLKPGQTLHVTAKMRKNSDAEASFAASGTVDGESAVSARIVLSKSCLAESRADLSDNDERMVQAMKDLYAQLRRDLA